MPRRPPTDRGADEAGTILVASDNPAAAEVIARVLEEQGHAVKRMESDEQTLAALDETTTAVVISGLGGEEADRSGLLGAIRENADARVGLARVVLVADGEADRATGWDLGADGVLIRPFHAVELIAEVGEVLARPDEERVPYRHEQLRAARRADTDSETPWPVGPADDD